MEQLPKRTKPDRAVLNLISGIADADWRTVSDVLNGGHTRTSARQRVLAALDALGIGAPQHDAEAPK